MNTHMTYNDLYVWLLERSTSHVLSSPVGLGGILPASQQNPRYLSNPSNLLPCRDAKNNEWFPREFETLPKGNVETMRPIFRNSQTEVLRIRLKDKNNVNCKWNAGMCKCSWTSSMCLLSSKVIAMSWAWGICSTHTHTHQPLPRTKPVSFDNFPTGYRLSLYMSFSTHNSRSRPTVQTKTFGIVFFRTRLPLAKGFAQGEAVPNKRSCQSMRKPDCSVSFRDCSKPWPPGRSKKDLSFSAIDWQSSRLGSQCCRSWVKRFAMQVPNHFESIIYKC